MRCSLSSGATTSSASQAIPCITQNKHIHYCCSQEPTSCPNPEPDESSPQPPIPFFVMHFNIGRPSMSSLSNWFCPSGSPTKILYAFLSSPTHATSLAHLIILYLNGDDDDHHHHDNDKTMVVMMMMMMMQTMEIQCMWDLKCETSNNRATGMFQKHS